MEHYYQGVYYIIEQDNENFWCESVAGITNRYNSKVLAIKAMKEMIDYMRSVIEM